jgi:chromosome segregation protein
MRLKQLELQGYKTFASRTEFLIEDGITAIVGPNGSGKSNIADAIRWVLGEQSYSVLRARRTEDMIFSGSERRARQGMARVTLTLDNTSGWLPIEFGEVTIERRAYRSNENEYYLNGSRVRLRDITELLGQSGLGRRTYTVIGQGLVDRALSLGPAERRALFEEAAGIAVYQDKRTDVLRKLEQTQQNIVRVNDVVNEIVPRLRHLEREAGRAQEQKKIAARLDELLRVWYGYRWREGTQALRLARTVAHHRQKSLQAVQADMDAVTQETVELRKRQEALRASLSQWHRESSALHAQAEALQRDMAVGEERARLLRAQREELLAELVPPQINRRDQAARVEAAQAELARVQTEVTERQAAAAATRRRLDALQAERQALLSFLTATRDRAFGLATDLADRNNRRAQIEERQAEIAQERALHGEKLTHLQAELSVAETAQTELQEQLTHLEAESAALQTRRTDQETHLARIEARCQALQAQLAETRQEETRLRDRHDLLARMREEGEGLYAGVRTVLRAARSGGGTALRGIVGALVSLIDVPAGLERAIEAALGARLQNVVVETWDDAVAAIEYLKRERGGRATFLPLDTLRPRQPLPTAAVTGIEGVVGLASDLVAFEARLRPAVDLALGQTLVVQDVTAARRAFNRLTGSFQIVTRAGEVLRSDGAVTGGAYQAARDDGLLAREREWRDLPARLAALAGRVEALARDLTAAQEDERAVEASLSEMQAQAGQRTARRAVLIGSLAERDREAGRLAQEIEWLQGLIRQATAEAETLQARDRNLEAEQQAISQEQARFREQIAARQKKLDELSTDRLLAELNRLQTALAVAQQTQAGQEAILDSHRATLAQLDAQLQARQSRIEALAQQADEVSAHLVDLTERHRAISGELAEVQAHIAPAENEIADLEARRAELDDREADLRQRLRQYEARYNQAVLEVTRREEEMAALKRQIEDELGLVEVEMDEGLRGQPPLPLHPIVSTLPTVEKLPEGLEEEMRHLRAQMRRLGAVNPNAPAEYAEQLERHTFLVSQAQDLQQAAAQLREVIAELDALMEKAFRETFDAVAGAFTGYFTRLFGGGTARLVLTEPNNVMESGVEIVARPPGKRVRGLALLSGGERALTATALIFAILQVNPPPFSVLDEVDAMLDEANVGRFVELLREQAQLNQFIVITHNRATMKAANVLYGVTMGDDSISRVYSKRLEDEESPDDGA